MRQGGTCTRGRRGGRGILRGPIEVGANGWAFRVPAAGRAQLGGGLRHGRIQLGVSGRWSGGGSGGGPGPGLGFREAKGVETGT